MKNTQIIKKIPSSRRIFLDKTFEVGEMILISRIKIRSPKIEIKGENDRNGG